MSYIISGVLIAIFVIWELTQFKKIVKLVALYQDIFPDNLKDLDFDKDNLRIRIQHHTSEVFLNLSRLCSTLYPSNVSSFIVGSYI